MMKSTKTGFKLICIMTAAALLTVGCGQTKMGPGEYYDRGMALGIRGEIVTVAASESWLDEAEYKLAEEFEAQTGVQIVFETIPDDKYLNTILGRMEDGTCPDIFMLQSGMSLDTTYHIRDVAADLSDEEWVSYYDADTCKTTSVDGHVYGMTYYDTTTDYEMIYNKKLFEEAGYDSAPTTWSGFISLCESLKDNGVTPIYEPIADGWHQTMLWADMGQVFEILEPGLIDSLNDNEVKFADDANMELALTQLAKLGQNGYFGNSYTSDSFDDAEVALATGNYAMCMMKSGAIRDIVYNDLNTGYTEDDFGIMLLPICGNHYLNVHPTGPARFVYNRSENVEAAKLYLSFIAEPESIQYMIDNSSTIENLPFDAGQTPDYSEAASSFIDSFDEDERGMVLQDVVKYYNEQWGEISADMAEMFRGNITPHGVLQNIDTRREKLASAADDPAWTE